ncbi:MAG: hypothetical protein U0353_27425 [Sandaracinus sp.]
MTERSPRQKGDALLHFFEAYAAFWATALLSLFLRTSESEKMWLPRVQQVLREQKQRLELASFGTWLTIVEFLSKEGRTLAGDKDSASTLCRHAALTSDHFLVEVLFSKSALQTLKTTNSLRNAWRGHVGIVSDATAATQLLALETHLKDLRAVVGERWGSYVLNRMGSFEYRDGIYQAQAERVMGTRAPFVVDTVELTGSVESGRLHLVGEGARDALAVLPFIRVMASPKTASNACYFYNRKTGDGVRFVSYHYPEDSDLTDRFDDTARAVAALSDSEA